MLHDPRLHPVEAPHRARRHYFLLIIDGSNDKTAHALIRHVEDCRHRHPSPTEAPDLERLALRLAVAGNYGSRVEGTLLAVFEDDAERLAQVFRRLRRLLGNRNGPRWRGRGWMLELRSSSAKNGCNDCPRGDQRVALQQCDPSRRFPVSCIVWFDDILLQRAQKREANSSRFIVRCSTTGQRFIASVGWV